MPAPPLYLDENVNHHIVEPLRQRGFNVTTARDEQVVGVDDDIQLAHAANVGRAILSPNRKHFHRLHADWVKLGREHAGILSIPQTWPAERFMLRTAMMLDWIALQNIDMRTQLLEWRTVQAWLEAGNTLPGYASRDVALALGR